MVRTLVATAALLLASVDALAAQIIRPQAPLARPLAWTSIAIGYLRMPKAIHDGPSNAYWNIRDAAQYRASLEVPLGRATSVGAVMTTARMPLVYAGTATTNSCALCDANVTVQQYMGVLHMSNGGTGFTEMLDVAMGVTRFTKIQQLDGSPLGTGRSANDLTFAAAYGMGYSFTRGLQLALQQEISFVAHKRVAGKPSNTAQQQTTRIGLRLALGAW